MNDLASTVGSLFRNGLLALIGMVALATLATLVWVMMI